VIAIVRDIRDALVRPLPEWLTEGRLNHFYREIWEKLSLFDCWLRYEALVMNQENVTKKISRVLSYKITVKKVWAIDAVLNTMFKDERHELLKRGKLSKSRVGIWKSSGKTFTKETHETAKMMGY